MAKKKAERRTRDRKEEAPAYRPFEKLGERLAKKPGARSPKRAAPKRQEPVAEHAPPTFEEHMRGVKPLGAKPARVPRTASGVERSRPGTGEPRDDDAPARERLHGLVTDAIRFEVADDGTSLEGRRLDVDPREIRRLRTMRYAVDGKLDLHGMKASEARAAVTRFLAKRASEGDRAVIVVHGKGSHSPRGDAVLRGEIGAWLSQGAAARHVLAFASVLDRAGESGSLFVLLTR